MSMRPRHAHDHTSTIVCDRCGNTYRTALCLEDDLRYHVRITKRWVIGVERVTPTGTTIFDFCSNDCHLAFAVDEQLRPKRTLPRMR